MKVQQDLDETKIVLVSPSCVSGSMVSNASHLQHDTLEALLERGERLDDLVAKTDKLSTTSKAFYKEARLVIIVTS